MHFINLNLNNSVCQSTTANRISVIVANQWAFSKLQFLALITGYKNMKLFLIFINLLTCF